jgi:hypothetical protein
MAFPRKGSRRIAVDGTVYRFRGGIYERDRMPGEVHAFRIQRARSPGQMLRAEITYARLRAEYRRVGRHVSRTIDSVPPYVVRQTILLGLARGWKPSQNGRELDLGPIDDAIDWAALH